MCMCIKLSRVDSRKKQQQKHFSQRIYFLKMKEKFYEHLRSFCVIQRPPSTKTRHDLIQNSCEKHFINFYSHRWLPLWAKEVQTWEMYRWQSIEWPREATKKERKSFRNENDVELSWVALRWRKSEDDKTYFYTSFLWQTLSKTAGMASWCESDDTMSIRKLFSCFMLLL